MRFTTARGPVRADFRANRLLQALAAVFAVLWVLAAISPTDRFDWFLENLLVAATVGLLAASYRRWPLSDLSYVLITAFLVLHTIGAHYTYAKVPAGVWLQEAWGLARNHYDRAVHFAFGLLIAYPVREVVLRWSGARRGWTGFLAFALMAAASATFEIVEWIVASIVSPQAAMAYLGTQGDVFDAQKDSTLVAAGAALALAAAGLTDKAGRRR